MKVNYGGLQSEAIGDFDTHALPVLMRLLSAAGLQSNVWAVIIIQCHPYGGSEMRPKRDDIRLFQDHAATRRIDARVRARSGNFSYQISFSTTGSADRWSDSVNRLRQAAASASTGSDRLGEIAKPPREEHLNGKPQPEIQQTSMSKVRSMRDGLDQILLMAEETEASEALLQEAKARYDSAKVKAAPISAKLNQATVELQEAQDRFDKASTTYSSRKQQLIDAERDVKQTERYLAEAKVNYAEVSEKAGPVRAEFDSAAAALLECENVYAERRKSIEDTPELAGILAALSKLTATKT